MKQSIVTGERGRVQILWTACRNCGDRPRHRSVCLPLYRETFPLSAPKLNKTERAILEDAISAMLEYPETADMEIWVNHQHQHGDDQPKLEQETGYCGTTACLAGHIALAAGLPPQPYVRKVHLERPEAKLARRAKVGTGHVSTIARRILKLPLHEEGRVFLHDEWPEPFRRRYLRAARPITKAKIMAERLRHYMNTGE